MLERDRLLTTFYFEMMLTARRENLVRVEAWEMERAEVRLVGLIRPNSLVQFSFLLSISADQQ